MPTDKINEINSIIESVAKAEGYRFVNVELAGKPGREILKVFIDKNGGVTVEDCANMSRQVGLELEAEDIVGGSYILEVSSPGLTRLLKKPADYKNAVGKLVKFTLRRPLENNRKALAIIDDANDISVHVTLKQTGAKALIDYADIAKAKLEVEF